MKNGKTRNCKTLRLASRDKISELSKAFVNIWNGRIRKTPCRQQKTRSLKSYRADTTAKFLTLNVTVTQRLRFNWLLTNKLCGSGVRLFSCERIHSVLKDTILKVLFMFAAHMCSQDVSGYFGLCVFHQRHFFSWLIARTFHNRPRLEIFLISRGETFKNILMCCDQVEGKWVLHICGDVD